MIGDIYMSTEDIKSNVTTSIAAPKKDMFDYSSELAQLKDTTELNELERPKTIGAYKLLIIRATQNYRARVLGELEKKIINIPGWEDVITDLVCLSGVIIDNFHKITNIDDLREFLICGDYSDLLVIAQEVGHQTAIRRDGPILSLKQ